VIIRSFATVGLSLPIDGSRDAGISLKEINMEQFIEGLKDWHIGGLPQPTLDSGSEASEEEEELLAADEDAEEFAFYDIGPPREEAGDTDERS